MTVNHLKRIYLLKQLNINMKKLFSLSLLLISLSLTLMTSCSSSKEKSDSNVVSQETKASNAEKLQGCWYFPREDKYFEFQENGVMRFYQYGDLMMAEYSLSGDTVKCHGEEFGDGTLVIKSITDSDLELYFDDAESADDYHKLKRISKENFNDILNSK